MKKIRVLIVDDNANTRSLYSDILADEGYQIVCAKDGEEALDLLKFKQVELVFLDLRLPDIDGLAILEKIRIAYSETVVIMISGEGDIESAVRALKLGAYDFLEKPIATERLLTTSRNALLNVGLKGKIAMLQEEIDSCHKMVGNSAVMTRLREKIDQASSTGAHVLITGETGSGKDIVARAIHKLSLRSLEPFVKINCAAIPYNLIESELFGYSRGAFTGANKDKRGRIEAADGGTIFFDEIGELTIQSQAKLLLFLESRSIERLGETTSRDIDVKVIAATNKNLPIEVQEKRFREDLYYRLNVIDIKVPALREHIEDIPELASYFLEVSCNELGIPKKQLDESAITKMSKYNWLGNVRQLRNVIEKTVSMSKEVVIRANDLHLLHEEKSIAPQDTNLHQALRDFERQLIFRVLEEESGHMSNAAKRLGIDRTNLYRKMKSFGIEFN